MINDILNWVAYDPFGNASGFVCFLSVPFMILIVTHYRGKKE